jgi:KDO2-lipid IV(A) lauroyltransferase
MSLSQNLRFRLEFTGFLLAEGVARALPLETASWLSGYLWRVIAPRLRRQKRALANLARAFPDMSLSERTSLAAAMWENLGRTFVESFRLKTLVESGRIAFAPDERFDVVARGAPFIVCGLHMGNWEILAHGGKRMGLPIAGVYQRMSNPLVEARMRAMRAPLYLGGLLPKTAITARALLRAIKGGACPSFLADLRDDRGAPVLFFGHPARSNLFPALLARATGVPLYAGVAFRRPNVRFTIRIEPILVPQTSDRDADALVATEALQRQFEAFIREAPEQWMWGHRKWD